MGIKVAVMLGAVITATTPLTAAHGIQEVPGVIRGRVTDSAGKPISAVTIRLAATMPSFNLTTTTDSLGHYLIADVPAANAVVLQARRVGFLPVQHDSLVLGSGDTLTVDVVMRPSAAVLPDVYVPRKGSNQVLPKVTKDELDATKAPNAAEKMKTLRPRVLVLMCGAADCDTRSQRPKFIETAAGPMTQDLCPIPEQIVIDGARMPPGKGVFEYLGDIPPEAVDSLEYVDCWRYDKPARERNALHVYTHAIFESPASHWATLSMGVILPASPLSKTSEATIALKDVIMVSFGYQARLTRRMVGRLSVGGSFQANRTVQGAPGCVICSGEEYQGGRYYLAEADLMTRLPKSPIGLGLGMGVRRYQLPNGAAGGCLQCDDAGLKSQTSMFVRPLLRLTGGTRQITTLEVGPYLSRFRGRTMVDVAITLSAGLPIGASVRKPAGAPVSAATF